MRAVRALQSICSVATSAPVDVACTSVRPVSSWITFASRSYSEAAALPAEDESRTMGPETRRTGVVAVKVGMTQEWDNWGRRLPLTVLWVDGCKVCILWRPDKEQLLTDATTEK